MAIPLQTRYTLLDTVQRMTVQGRAAAARSVAQVFPMTVRSRFMEDYEEREKREKILKWRTTRPARTQMMGSKDWVIKVWMNLGLNCIQQWRLTTSF